MHKWQWSNRLPAMVYIGSGYAWLGRVPPRGLRCIVGLGDSNSTKLAESQRRDREALRWVGD